MSADVDYDAIVIGAGPAGLSAALNLVRARRSTLLVDANRPRNSATLHSHGFLTRDGVPPLELRRLGREEFEGYPDAAYAGAMVSAVERAGEGFSVTGRGVRGGADVAATASTVVITSGLSEKLPAFPSIRAWYGTDLHSCMECDGWEKAGLPLALLGESSDLAERALLLSQWSDDIIVFTNGSDAVSAEQEEALAVRGVSIEHRLVADVVGEAGHMTGVLLADGEEIPRSAGFVRPEWTAAHAYLGALDIETDDAGLLLVDHAGRTSVRGLYAAGDLTPPGPEQLIIAAGEGARVAATVNRDLLGVTLPDATV